LVSLFLERVVCMPVNDVIGHFFTKIILYFVDQMSVYVCMHNVQNLTHGGGGLTEPLVSSQFVDGAPTIYIFVIDQMSVYIYAQRPKPYPW
jgi:hypothetical protein